MPKVGIRLAETTLKENGYEPDQLFTKSSLKYVTTVNDGIFRAYTSNIRRARHAHTVTESSRCILTRTYYRVFTHVLLFTVQTT